MAHRVPILTDRDHRNMDTFFKHLLDEFKSGEITKEQVIGGLAQIIGAIDSGNHGEAAMWFEHGREQVHLLR